MLSTDALSDQADLLMLYIFDERGILTATQSSGGMPLGSDYHMTLNDLPAGNYHFVAWARSNRSNTEDGGFDVPNPAIGSLSLRDMNGGKDYYAVFRNSVYKLSISKFSGLGDDVPGGRKVDPSGSGESGNPPIDADNGYIQASVDINPWVIGGKDYYAVFRNSVYKLSISKFSGLGDDVPGGRKVDPSGSGESGNPPIDADNGYIQASVDINPWVVNLIGIDF
ncbi:Major fimbrial subunit protein type IV, Fimbrillin, C-terminal [Popillia japonica]|uniref:Major fimbrial subunit protein type IV, Fimbrillin, C-terminal n=1 Tax=Popillia japonica TaxID=7064 RepID=A0AAW1GSB2_POPJA